MSKTIYGIFSGEYSDWNIHGYFEDRDKAEKYCALKNRRVLDTDDEEEEYWYSDSYYVLDINNINEKVEDISLNYYHEVVFDFRGNEGAMRVEPDRYEYYIGEDKKSNIRWNTFKDGSGWISFSFNCNSREKAEKIAQDKFAQILYTKQEVGSWRKTFELMEIERI